MIPPGCHSWRRDCTGSTRIARRAGPNAAASATAAIESIRLNAAVLAINGGVREDWAGALKLAEATMTSGEAARLIERIRAYGAVGAR